MLHVGMPSDDPLLDHVHELKCTEQGDQFHCILGSGPGMMHDGEIEYMDGQEDVYVDRVDLEGGLNEQTAMSAETQGFHVQDMAGAMCFVEESSISGRRDLECYPQP